MVFVDEAGPRLPQDISTCWWGWKWVQRRKVGEGIGERRPAPYAYDGCGSCGDSMVSPLFCVRGVWVWACGGFCVCCFRWTGPCFVRARRHPLQRMTFWMTY